MKLFCKHCNEEFDAERKRRLFCSTQCCYDNRKGVIRGSFMTEEAKAKISKARRGRKLSSSHKKAISESVVLAYREGRKTPCPPTSKGWKDKIGLGLKKAYSEGRREVTIPKLCGPQHPAWKGGITPVNTSMRNSIKMKRWRDFVFERDKFTCKQCGAQNGQGRHVELNAHHIKPLSRYQELAFDKNNGITLCVTCHKSLHKGV